MRIGILSDLHLEFYSTTFAIAMLDKINAMKNKVDWIVLAGDLHSDTMMRDYFLSQIEVPYKAIMGNHDYYKKAHFDDFIDEDGIVGGCLWTNFNDNVIAEIAASRNINDFHLIHNWTTFNCRKEYEKTLERIFSSESEIVVTHFAPSKFSVTDQYKGDVLNDYFCNSLEHMIINSNKKLWIHGHVHSDHDYMIGDCRIVSNVVGYPNELRKDFQIKVIDI